MDFKPNQDIMPHVRKNTFGPLFKKVHHVYPQPDTQKRKKDFSLEKGLDDNASKRHAIFNKSHINKNNNFEPFINRQREVNGIIGGVSQLDIPNVVKPLPLNRTIFNDLAFQRPNFIGPNGRPRQAVDFQKQMAIENEFLGEKFRLSDSTLDQLPLRLPDPTDETYGIEGRPQRTLLTHFNMANATASINENLITLQQLIANNATETRANMGRIFPILQALLLQSDRLSPDELKLVSGAIGRVVISNDRKTIMGTEQTIFTGEEIRNKGLILPIGILLAINKRDITHPFKLVDSKGMDNGTMSIASILSPGFKGYVDVKNFEVYPINIAFDHLRHGENNYALATYTKPGQPGQLIDRKTKLPVSYVDVFNETIPDIAKNMMPILPSTISTLSARPSTRLAPP